MKDKNVAAILALFLGSIGVHKFYLGRIGAGILYLVFSLTFVPALLGLIDFFVLALMDNDEFNRKFNGANVLPGYGPVVVNMLPPQGGFPGYGMNPGGMNPGGMNPGGMNYGSNYGPNYGYPNANPTMGYGPSRGSSISSADDLKVQLEKLNELRISGLLTEDEFQSQKRKLLDLI